MKGAKKGQGTALGRPILSKAKWYVKGDAFVSAILGEGVLAGVTALIRGDWRKQEGLRSGSKPGKAELGLDRHHGGRVALGPVALGNRGP